MLDKEKFEILPPELGSQFPEFRGFARTFFNDPEKQARAMRFIVGFYGLVNYESHSNPDEGKILKESLSNITDFFVKHYPEFMEEEVQIDSECGGGTYHREERLAHFVMKILSEVETEEE
ncbi:MAG: hypothetical protein WCK26_00210 [Candidatus Saccharibacteria bacterium]